MDTNISEKTKRQIRVAPFIITLICFILPFIQISCQGQKVVALTGLQLATGTEIDQKDPFSGEVQKKPIPRETTILLVLVCAAAATGLCFVTGKAGKLFPAIAGGIGFVLMLVAKSRFDNDILKEGQGVLSVGYAIGFILVCIFLLAGAVICGFQYKQGDKPTSST